MILVVDDDATILKALTRLLQTDGHRTEAYSCATEALAALDEEPALIISDVLMPEMDGFAFRDAYLQRYPERQTPFVFLSALTEVPQIVKGLDHGADEYFTKPIEPDVFRAKVRALLRRSQRGVGARFSGDMQHLSLVQVLQFCEQRSLTGRADFSTPRGPISVRFKSGEMEMGDDEESVSQLAELMDLEEGKFIIESRPIGFSEIEEARRYTVAPPAPPPPTPMGRLSGVRIGEQLFQLQTEYEAPPVDKIVTVVILDGQVLQKKSTEPAAGLEEADLRGLMAKQHGEIEQALRAKLVSLSDESSELPPSSIPSVSAPESSEAPAESDASGAVVSNPAIAPPPPLPAMGQPMISQLPDKIGDQARPLSAGPRSLPPSKERLFDMGLRKWRENDLEGALAALELAQENSPNDRALEATLGLVRRKLKAR